MAGAEGHDHVHSRSEAERFWTNKLAGRTAEPFPDLTGNRASAKNGETKQESILSQVSVHELQVSVAKLETSPLAVSQAAWAILLHTYSESDAPTVTFGAASQPLSEADQETLQPYSPAHLEIVNGRTSNLETLKTSDVLARFAQANIAAQAYPFHTEDLQEPCYDTAIIFRPKNNSPVKLPSKLAVIIEILPNLDDDTITLTVIYSTHVLTAAAAVCVLEQLDDVFAHILAHPDAPYLTSYTAIRLSLQSARNPNPPLLPTPAGPLLHSWFECHAQESPDALALWFKYSLDAKPAQADVLWTYAELNMRANRLARVLRSVLGGDISDEPIALLMEKCPGLYLSMLAVLKAGGAWCPLDAAAPALRNRDMLARAGGRLVIFDTEERRKAALEDEVVPDGVLAFSLEDPRLAEETDGSDLRLEIPSNHLAYLIWTSGTTGLPKGVPVEHRAIVQTIASEEQVIPWNEATGVRHMQFSAATFDVSITDIFYTWAKPCGAVTTATRELLVGRFPELVNAFRATHCNLTPSFMATFPLSECPTMKVVCSEGEKLPDVIADAWNVEGGVSVNCYGPAECAVTIITRSWKAGEEKKAANVGYPLPSGSCFAIKGNTILPRGAAGELALGGPQLARGYLGQPDQTAAKFIEHPAAGRIYLTGDVVRFLHDGTCEFVGRNDDLIKIGGIRIELSEISAALNRSHPLAREAATFQLRRPDRPMDVICTFIVVPSLSTSSASEPSELAVEIARSTKATAERLLPSYMLPHIYIPVQRLPVTASNKIDRKALGAIYAQVNLVAWEKELGAAKSSDVEAVGEDADTEWTDVEKKLRDAVVGLTRVSPDAVSKGTQLKALGIDSIHAIFLASRFRSFGIELAVADIIQHNSIRELCQVLEHGPGVTRINRDVQDSPVRQRLLKFNHAWLPVVELEVTHVEKVIPCTPLQEGMLGETIKNPRSYWTHHLLTLDPTVDLERLRSAWKMVAQANEALRVAFVPSATLAHADEVGEEFTAVFIQILLKEAQVDWTTVQVSGVLEDIARERAVSFVTDRSGSNLPPWGVTLLAFDDGRRVLMFSVHHAIHDADTLDFIFNDVRSAYSTGAARERPQLSDALLLTQPANLEECVGFWSEALAEFADPHAPAFPDLTNRGRRIPNDEVKSIFHRIPTSTSPAAISAAAQQLGCPLGNIIQAAWAVVLCAHLETNSIVFGETTSDRLRAPTLGSVYGPMVVAAPVPCQLGGDVTCRTLVSELSQLYDSSLPYRHVRLAKVRQALKRPSEQPVFGSMFVVHVEGDSADNAHDEKQIWTRHPNVVGLFVEHPLALNVEIRKSGAIDLEICASENVVSPQQLELLSHEVDAILSIIVAKPDHPLLQITALPDFPERLLSVSHSTPSEWLRNTRELPPTWALEHYAKHHPDYLALIVASAIKQSGAIARQWTYRELNDYSNRIGNFILSLGVREKVIGFSMDRTLESYAYQIGIFKTGNTYLPIEEELPVPRKLLLMKDSGAVLVLTTRDAAEHFADCEPGVQVVHVDSAVHRAALATQPTTAPERVYNPDAAAYVLYTSGSTGMPKGVMVSYHNLTSFIAAIVEAVDRDVPITDVAGKGRYLGRTSIAFDPHLFEILGTFSQGIAIASAPRSMILDDLRLTMESLRVTHASLVPSLLERSGISPADVPFLRWISVGGEKISSRVVDVWGNDPGGLVLYNAYGPTELTIGCSIARVSKDSSTRNIGKIFDNCTAYVLRPGTLQPVLRGEPGELCVTGDLVAMGYLNRPDAKGFVDNFRGRRMYRTGDMVRLLADNSLDYLGRGDDQAKVRGQRLELAEVTEFLRANAPEGAAISTLIVRHPSMNRDWLVSFVGDSSLYIKANNAIDPSINHAKRHIADDLQSTCREQLPAFMVPDVILMVDFIPLASNSGKADAKSLRQLLKETPLDTILGEQSEGPRTSLSAAEARVRDVLAGCVKVKADWTPETTTLAVGVDSLMSITLRFKLKAAGFDAPLPFLLSGPTIEAIAKRSTDPKDHLPPSIARARQHIAELEAAARPHLQTLFTSGAVYAVRPALPLQEGLVVRSMDSSTPAYLNHLIYRLKGDVNRVILAIDNTVLVNEILRTCFPRVGDQIVQAVLSPETIPTLWQHFSLPRSEVPVQVIEASFGDSDIEITKNLDRVPPVRFALWHGEDQDYLALTIHHSIYDGESLPRLLKEIEDRYFNKEVVARTPFSAVVEYVVGQDINEAKAFYSQYLQNLRLAPALEPVIDGLSGIGYEVTPALHYSEVNDRARLSNVSLHSYLQSAFAAALAEHFKHDDIVFGTVLSGRVLPIHGAEDILAPCVTTVPVRARFKHGMLMKDVAQKVHRDSPSLLSHQHTSLRLIQRWSGVDRPLFDVLFAFARGEADPLSPEIWEQCANISAVDYHLAVEIEARETDDKLFVRTMYTPTFGEHAARAIVNRVQSLLLDLETPVNLHGVAVASLLRATRKRKNYSELTWSQTEEDIRSAVAEVCGIEKSVVTKNISFLRLGLDSISSIRLAQRLRDSGIHTRSATIMSNTSVGALASHLSADGAASAEDDRVAKFQDISRDFLQTYALAVPLLAPDDVIEAVYPATPLQTAMLSATLASQGTAYVIPHPFRLDYSVEIGKLRASWDTVLSRLEISRTTFHIGNDVPWVAAVHKYAPLRWKEHRIQSTASQDHDIGRILESTRVTSIEGFEVPPMEVHIIYDPDGTIFMPVTHHSLYDGISLHYILDDVLRVYHGLEVPVRPQFSAALPYVLHRPHGDVEFWRKYLRGYKPASIYDTLHNAQASAHVREQRATVAIEKVEQACQALEITTQAAVLLAWGKVLATLTSRRDIVFGHVIAGRAIPLDNAFEVAGPLFNTVPFRFDISDNSSTNAQLARVQNSLIVTTDAYQHTPLRDIQAACKSGSLFDTLFVFQNLGRGTSSSDEPTLWTPTTLSGDDNEPQYPLNVEVEHHSDHITLRASCKSGIMDAPDLTKMLQTFDRVLTNLIENPDELANAFPEALQLIPSAPVIADTLVDHLDSTDVSDELEEWGKEETILRQVLAEVAATDIQLIRRHTPLYALGLDSIAAIHIASNCRRQGLLATVADVVTGGHIEGICARVAARPRPRQNLAQAMITADDRKKALDILNITEDKTESILPALAGQQYHLAAWLACGRRYYEAPFVFRLPKNVDRTRLAAAWRSLRERHGILRTTFAALSEDRVVQVVLKSEPGDDPTFAYIEAGADLQSRVVDLLKAEANAPSDLFSPPVRGRHIHAEEGDAFVVMLHHSLYDGWSIPLLAADLAALYDKTQCESSLGYVDLVEHIFGTRDENEHRAYWTTALGDSEPTLVKSQLAPPISMQDAHLSGAKEEHMSLVNRLKKGASRWLGGLGAPAERTPSKVKTDDSPATFVARSVLEDISALNSAALKAHVSVPALLIGAAARVISRQTGVANPVLQHWHTARSAAVDEIERIAGPVVNVLPLRVANAQGGTLVQVSRQIQNALGESAEHEQVGWVDALRFSGQQGVLSNVQVNILWHTDHLMAQQSSLLEYWNLGLPTDIAPKNALPGKTAVDLLDRSYIPEKSLAIDIALNPNSGHVDIVIKNEVMLSEKALEALVKDFKDVIVSGTMGTIHV